MSENMEDTVIVLPMVEDGVIGLGDLWDCRSCTCPGNIFNSPLEVQHLEAHPMKDLTYSLTHVKDTKDTMNRLHIGASLSIEAMEGKLKIKGEADFTMEDTTDFRSEKIMCDYKLNTFIVRVRPNVVDDNKVDERMKNAILDGKIKATHYVQSIRLGAEAAASMDYSHNITSNNMDIKGNFSLDLTLTAVTIQAKADLQILTDENVSAYKTSINVRARPRFEKSPTKVEDMFEQIEKLDQMVDSEKHFADTLGEHIVGVPLSFRLVPITQLFDVGLESFYKMMEEDIMKQFQSMLFTLQDFQGNNYIKKMLNVKDPRLMTILSDPSNPFTSKITEREIELSAIAKELKFASFEVFGKYKDGEVGIEGIQEIIKRYDTEFDIVTIMSEVELMAQEGKSELNGIHASDVNDDSMVVKFFTNVVDLEGWWGAERNMKLLLQTSSEESSPGGAFLRLFNLSGDLAKLNIEVGVAFPNISDDFSLTVKIQGREKVYKGEDINFALEVFAITIEKGNYMSSLFYNVTGILNGLQLPITDINDVTSLIEIMKDYREVTICESYPQLLASLGQTLDTWNIVLPLQGLHTSVEMTKFFRQLRAELPVDFPGVKHKWLVGRFDINNSFDAPLLFLFKDDLLKAVCNDHLDILHLKNLWRNSPVTPDLSLISYTAMKTQSFYSRRVNFALQIIEGLVLDHATTLTDPIKTLEVFPENEWTEDEVKVLDENIAVVRTCAIRNELEILTLVARHAIKCYPSLPTYLYKYGWTDGGFGSLDSEIKWGELTADLKKFLADQAPYLVKVSTAIDQLVELGKIKVVKPTTPAKKAKSTLRVAEDGDGGDDDEEQETITEEELEKRVNTIVKFLVDFDVPPGTRTRALPIYKFRSIIYDEGEVFEGLVGLVESYRDGNPELKLRGILSAFQDFYQNEIQKPEYFHLVHLTSLVDSLSTNETIKHLFIDLAKDHCSSPRFEIDDEKYPGFQKRITDSIEERNLYKTTGFLTQLKNNSKLLALHMDLYNLTSISNAEQIKNIIENMISNEFEPEQIKAIWWNRKFQEFIRMGINNDGVIETLYFYLCIIPPEEEGGEETVEIPSYIPEDIQEKLKPLLYSMNAAKFIWNKGVWKSIDDVIQTFQIIFTRKLVPEEFMETMRHNFEINPNLREEMRDAKSLFYWNEKELIFNYPWSLANIGNAIQLLLKKYKPEVPQISQIPMIDIQLQLPETIPRKLDSSQFIPVNEIWRRFTTGSVIEVQTNVNLIKLSKLLNPPTVDVDELSKTNGSIIPYMMQRVKFDAATAFYPTFVQNFINYLPPGPRPGIIDFNDGDPKKAEANFFLSRGDLLTVLLSSADTLISYHILNNMSKVPMALPLTIPSIFDSNPAPKVMLRLLQSIIVDELVDTVADPHLLKKNFRLVIALRIGDTKTAPGRSTIINQLLMSDRNMFSSLAEPGAENGHPLFRKGLVEFTWLSRTTCQQDFYEGVVKPYYDSYSSKQEMVLLALLHGDALDATHYLQLLKVFASSFIIFWKTQNWSELINKKKEISKIIGKGPEILDVVISPDDSVKAKIHEQNIILFGNDETNGVTRGKLHSVFKSAISCKAKIFTPMTGEGALAVDDSGEVTSLVGLLTGCSSKQNQKSQQLANKNSPPLVEAEGIACPEAKALLEFIQSTTVERVKEAIQIGDPNNRILYEMTVYFLRLLNVAEDVKDGALVYFNNELNHLSKISSKRFRDRVVKVQNEVFYGVSDQKQIDPGWLMELQNEIKSVLKRLEITRLDIDDIFGHLNKSIEAIPKSLSSNYVEQYFNYFKAGFPIRIFDQKDSSLMWTEPIKSIFEKIEPTTRVFVVSVMGYQGSGKSALLNRLFGNGFKEEIGGCTKGLQTRILWLNEELRVSLETDAIIVIDSEGLGKAENTSFVQVDIEERKLATFLLGISHLCLINVFGESMEELSSILEMSLTTLTSLAEGKILFNPDLMLVRQRKFKLERNVGNPEDEVKVLEQYKTAIDNLRNITPKYEFELGTRVREDRRAEGIKQRIKHNEFYYEIESKADHLVKYNTDITKIYQHILDSCSQSSHVKTISEWYSWTQNFWQELDTKMYLTKYKDLADTENSLILQGRINTVRGAIDIAFRSHEKQIKATFEDALEQLFDTAPETEFNENFLSTQTIEDIEILVEDFKTEKRKILQGVHSKLRQIVNSCTGDDSAGGGKAVPLPCKFCAEAFRLREELFQQLTGTKDSFPTMSTINDYMTLLREGIWNKYNQVFVANEVCKRVSPEFNEKIAEILAQNPDMPPEDVYKKFKQYLSTYHVVVPAKHQIEAELADLYGQNLSHVLERINDTSFPDLEKINAFDIGHYNNALISSVTTRKVEILNWSQNDWLLAKLEDVPKDLLTESGFDVYQIGMTREWLNKMKKLLLDFETVCMEKLLPDFMWEAHLFGIKMFIKIMQEKQIEWDVENNPLVILETKGQKDEFLKDPGSFFGDGKLSF